MTRIIATALLLAASFMIHPRQAQAGAGHENNCLAANVGYDGADLTVWYTDGCGADGSQPHSRDHQRLRQGGRLLNRATPRSHSLRLRAVSLPLIGLLPPPISSDTRCNC
jgi:hypothetical protein